MAEAKEGGRRDGPRDRGEEVRLDELDVLDQTEGVAGRVGRGSAQVDRHKVAESAVDVCEGCRGG